MKTAIDLIKAIPPLVWILILAAALGVQSWYLLEVIAKSEAQQASIEILTKGMESDRERNRIRFDSLQGKIHLQVDFNNQIKEDLAELDRTKADINSKADDEKTDIGRIRDLDSLRNAVTRFYRR